MSTKDVCAVRFCTSSALGVTWPFCPQHSAALPRAKRHALDAMISEMYDTGGRERGEAVLQQAVEIATRFFQP